MSEERKTVEDKNLEDIELKKLVKKNLELNLEILDILNGIKKNIAWQRIFSLLKLLILAVPVILGFIYLPPMFADFLDSVKTYLIELKAS